MEFITRTHILRALCLNGAKSRPAKRICPFLACALVIICAGNAESAETWAQSYGSRSYNPDGSRNSVDYEYGSGFDWVTGIAAMPDGGFVVAGQIDLPERYADVFSDRTGSYSDAALVRYAADGKILWQQQIRQTNDTMNGPSYQPAPSRVFKILADAQGNIFICGGKGNPNNAGQLPFVAKFAPDGALVWQNGIDQVLVPYQGGSVDGGIQAFTSMALTRDGGVLVGMYEGRAMSNSHQVPAIAKFNSDGSLGFHGAYEHPAQYDRTYAVAASRSDSNSYLWITSNYVSSSNVGITAVRVGGNAAVSAERSFSREGRYETPIAAVGTDDGGFVILSQQGALSNGVPDGRNGFVVRKLNAALKPVFEKFIQRANQDLFRADGIVPTADGGFVISGTTSATEPGTPGATGTEAAIVRLNASGDLQFVSVLGGPENEGFNTSFGEQYITTYAVAAEGGGYGMTTASHSYLAEPELDNGKTDWWTLKTDNARKVKNFDGVMVDLPLSKFVVAENVNPGDVTTRFTRIPNAEAQAITSKQPGFTIEDLARKEGINKPDVLFQGSSSPRIISSDTAEAIIGQHFSYHIIAGFVAPDAKLTHNAIGLPDGFVLDAKTGVISGAPKAGSQTQKPILITLKVNDGTDVGTLVLSLTIGFGKPQFAVNDSDEPKYPGSSAAVTGLKDTPLRFSAKYAGALAGQLVRVQASTSPGVASSWNYIQNGSDSYMTYDVTTKRFVINSINYPGKNPVYFRAVATADAYPTAISNVVGPFNLASSTPRVGGTVFHLERNGRRADLDFRADLISARSDAALRVESTKTPADEESWTDLSDGNSGQMKQEANRKAFSLIANQIPPDEGVYFRAVARATGAADSLSNIIGPYVVRAETPPLVKITAPPLPAATPPPSDPCHQLQNCPGERNNPLVIKTNANGVANFKITANAASDNFIKSLKILVDGAEVQKVTGGQNDASLNYTTIGFATHVIEALAIDEFDATARAGTSPLFVSIEPPDSGASNADRQGSDGGDVAAAASAGPRRYTVAKSGGSWNDPATWTWKNRAGETGTGVPGKDDYVSIKGVTVRLGAQQEAWQISFYEGSRLIGPGVLRLHGDLEFNEGSSVYGGAFDAGVRLIVLATARLDIWNDKDLRLEGIVENHGRVNFWAEGDVSMSQFINSGAMYLNFDLVTPTAVAAGLPLAPPVLNVGSLDTFGKISALIGQDGAGLVNAAGGRLIGQDGAGLIGQDGAGLLGQDGAGILANDGASCISNDGASLLGQDGAGLLGQDGAGIIAGGAGNLTAPRAAGVAAAAPQDSDTNAATSPASFVQTGGETDLTGIFVRGKVVLNGGVLGGSGVIVGSLTNHAGYVAPGNSAGAITVTGAYEQDGAGTLIVDAEGAEAGQFDRLTIGGTATLGGKLIVQTLNGYTPLPGDPFNPIGYKSVSGSFASVTGNVQIDPNPTGVLTTLKRDAPNPAAPKLLNISTRMRVEQGANVLIGGFYITGSSSKKVLIRALGPSLKKAGIIGTLEDPTLELDKNGADRKFNDDWKSGTPDQIPNGFAPSDQRESVIVATVAPGPHTAIVSGKGDNTGVAVVEVYDLESGAPEALANISTRGFVQTGDNVMIGGFILGGSQPADVLIRAIGPSLPKEIESKLADPQLELRDANGSSMTNDDWRNTQEAEIAATGVPPPNGRESAIVATLVPGGYTAIIRGKGDTTGVAVFEAYNLQ